MDKFIKYSLAIILVGFLFSCNHNISYYRDVETGKTYDEHGFQKFQKENRKKYLDSAKYRNKGDQLEIKYGAVLGGNKDSVIFLVTYSVKIGDEYIKNPPKEKIYSFINKELPVEEVESFGGKKKLDFNDGKPTLINFWFINCPPCRKEIPYLNELKKKFGEKVDFIAVTFESKDDLTKFLNKEKYDFVQVYDAQKYIQDLGLKSFPTNIFIDRYGIVRHIEGSVLLNVESNKFDISHFESILEDLISR